MVDLKEEIITMIQKKVTANTKITKNPMKRVMMKDQTLKMEKKAQKKIQDMKKDQKKKVKMVDLKEEITTIIQKKVTANTKITKNPMKRVMMKK